MLSYPRRHLQRLLTSSPARKGQRLKVIFISSVIESTSVDRLAVTNDSCVHANMFEQGQCSSATPSSKISQLPWCQWQYRVCQ